MKITKIGCVQHDCAECKRKAKSARKMKRLLSKWAETPQSLCCLPELKTLYEILNLTLNEGNHERKTN